VSPYNPSSTQVCVTPALAHLALLDPRWSPVGASSPIWDSYAVYVSDYGLLMAIVIVPFPGSRCDQICQKERWEGYLQVWYSRISELTFWCGVKALKFLSYSVMSRAEIQHHCQLPDVITSKPLIGWEQVNTSWKAKKVPYIFGIQLPVRIQT
jgi:hypothetical protein